VETSRALGTVEQRVLYDIAHGIVARDTGVVLKHVSDIFSTGLDPAMLLREFVHFWREVFVAKVGGEAQLQALGLRADSTTELLRLVAPLEVVDVQDLWDVARDGADRALRSSYPRYGFEALVTRMATRQPVAQVGALLGQLLNSKSSDKAGAPRAPVGTSVSQRAEGESRPKVAAPVTNPSTAAAQVSTPQDPPSGGAFGWDEVVSFATASTTKVLLENLRRIKPVRCEVGVFEGTAPDFTATSVMREKEKVSALLDAFLEKRGIAAPRAWKIVIQKGPGAIDSSAKTASRVDSDKEMQGHPAVQSLQKFFPGSKVEQVKAKD
jgi:DNA polymerase III gamma/tau subunit